MYELGAIYPAAINVFDENGQPANAATVTLVITQPDGTTVTCTVTNPPAVTGQYTYPFPTVQPGRHWALWTTSSPTTVYRDVFDVNQAVPDAIISLADAKQTLAMDPADTSDDMELLAKLQAVTHAVQRYMHTQYVPRQITEIHHWAAMDVPWGRPRLRLGTGTRSPSTPPGEFLPILSVQSMVTLSTDGTNSIVTTYDTVNNMDYDAETGLITVFNGPPLAGRIQDVFTAGYTIIPYNVIEGAKVLLQHEWESRRGPGGLSGVLGAEELGDYRHFTGLPRKAMDWLGIPRPVVFLPSMPLTRPFSSNVPAAVDAVVQAWTAGFAAQLAAGGDRVYVRDGQWIAAESGGAWAQDLAVGWYGFYPGYQYPSRSMSEELGESVVTSKNVQAGWGPSQEETFSISCASMVGSGGDPKAANWSEARQKAWGNIATAAGMIADPQIGGIYLDNVVESLTIGAETTMHEVAGRRGILVIVVFSLECVGTSQQ